MLLHFPSGQSLGECSVLCRCTLHFSNGLAVASKARNIRERPPKHRVKTKAVALSTFEFG